MPFSICVGSPVVLSPSALLTVSGELRNDCSFWSFFFQCGFFLSLLCPASMDRNRPRPFSGRPNMLCKPPGAASAASHPPNFFLAQRAQNSSSSPPHPQNVVANPLMSLKNSFLDMNTPLQYLL